MTFLSALGTPITRRFEVCKVEADRSHLTYEAGLCEVEGNVADVYGSLSLTREDGIVGGILLTGLPIIATDFSSEPTVISASLSRAGLTTLVAIPVFSREARLTAVAAWYF